ncbi:MAG TPA: MFS transporter [Alphaproteobacteria bacterium]|nr:MFS transporter [Alphaproteobacteria bacterium]
MAPSQQDSIETPYGWVILAASLAVITAAVATNYLIIVGIKPMAESMDWPRWVTSSAYSVVAIGSGIGGIFVGLWSDKRGIGWPLVMAGSSLAIGGILLSQVQDPFLMIICCFLFLGVCGNGAVFSPLIANATRWFDRRRGIAVAMVMGGQNLAGALWSPTFEWSFQEIGWRQTWLIYGLAVGLVIVPFSLILRRRPPQIAPGSAAPPERHAIESRFSPMVVQGLLCFAIIGCCVAMAMPLVHIAAYCSDLGFGLDQGAQMLSVLLACGFVSRMVFGWISDKIGGLMTIFIGASLQALALTLFAFIDSLMGLYLVSALFGLVFGGIVPSYALATRQLFPARQAAARIGVIFMAGYIGMGGGGFLGGVIFDLTLDYKLAFLTGVVFNIVNLLCLSLLLISRQKGQPLVAQPAE